MITHGSANGHFYIIMMNYGQNLKQMLRASKYSRFSLKTAVQIGIQLIDRLETLHTLGFIHVDLKPDNVVLRTRDKTELESSELVLIDFGVSKRYLDEKGDHLPQQQGCSFVGNMMF
jgi:serine/threonine protein kinase